METFEIRWYKNSHNNPVLLYKDLKVQESAGDPQYSGRASLIGELEKGNASLKLGKLTLADRGEYVCLVKSITWYESAKVNLTIRVLGSSPLFSLAEAGDQVNVTCGSGRWSPKPTLTWRDKGGRVLPNSHVYYKTDSKGLVRVSSWLLVSPSESEWLSCSVGISGQEVKEGRVLPDKRLWRKVFIYTLVVSLIIITIIIIIILALLLVVRSVLYVDPPSHLHTFTMENIKNRTYCALISPGVKDTEPVTMLLIYITSVLFCSAASEFSLIVPSGSVSEPLGSSVVLPCGLSPSLNAKTFEVRWYKNNYKNLVLLYKDLKVQENTGDPQYRGRVSPIGELEKGNVSLKLENLTLADRGEYLCYVKSFTWYESATVNLTVKVLGSPPLFSLAEAGNQVNVTCVSGGWSPKPTLNWRDSGRRELEHSHIQYKTDSEGLVRVSSWLLVSPSESEWISCSVGVSDQEVKEARVVPHKGFWREAFISILVLSLIIILIIIILTALLLVVRSGLFPHGLFHKHAKAADNPRESSGEEGDPLTGTSSPVPSGSAEETIKIWNKHKERKEKLTTDPESRHRSLTTTREGTGVYLGQLDSYRQNQSDPFPPALSREVFSSGLNYWEVKVKRKLSWCVGVTQKPPTKETFTALCYEEGRGIYPSTDPRTGVSAEGHITTLGLLLDFNNRRLSFYNVDLQSHLHTFTMENMTNRTYCALISPGSKDTDPVCFDS
ncbi:hypothetical protein NFI96_020723 [Prochilodus magdalenae]|nr:hypothetical protein NFI96_020723 [Prochilodus magdalenae]